MALPLDTDRASAEGPSDLHTLPDQPENMPPADIKSPAVGLENDSKPDIIYLRGARFATIAFTFVAVTISDKLYIFFLTRSCSRALTYFSA